ncbi:MAG: helix-turn-helix domain-containing protein [Thermoplasmata archaeon]|nr:helix-turn-helix domain-containing protein [Thermoplasmata archaeon]MCI4332225.1 helix-turn-helix domain-containing protein [Thermoplasmata archaeon]
MSTTTAPPQEVRSTGAGPAPLTKVGSAFLEALGDEQTRAILLALDLEELDVHELVLRTGLPQSSVYRKLHDLEEAELVRIVRYAFTPEGRKVEIYRSRLREVRVHLGNGRVRLEMIPREDSADRLGSMWEEVQVRRP